MTMLSYAQNFEDVMLNRLFHDVEDGFYVDIGAWEPEVDSVTKHFYERGWHGINVEPVPELLSAFQRERPRDCNLAVAVGAEAGEATLYDFSPQGLSTLDPETAVRMQHEGFEYRERPVEVVTLATLLDRHAGDTVHFLKIDVEGGEAGVIAGADFSRHRPIVLVIEATLSLTQIEAHLAWEPKVTDAGYEFVYYDGLNRFYLREEDARLRKHFATPPNLFDDFAKAELVRLREQRDAEHARARALDAELQAEATGYHD